jgi:hypothetical protein
LFGLGLGCPKLRFLIKNEFDCMHVANKIHNTFFWRWREGSYGVNFAIALSRMTGWLLHVDWFKPEYAEEHEKAMVPLRIYVGDHSNNIFDFVGKESIGAFALWVITPILD